MKDSSANGVAKSEQASEPENSLNSSRVTTTPRSLPWVVLLIVILSSAYAQTLQYGGAKTPVPEDFVVYYLGAKLAAMGRGTPLYYAPPGRYPLPDVVWPRREPGTLWDKTAHAIGFSATLHFVTPPFTALVLEPLVRLSWARAYKVWCWLTDLMVFASLVFILKLAGTKPFWPSLAVAMAAVFAFFPYVMTIWYGQINGLILLAWTLGIYFWSIRRTGSSAFCFAFGTMLKIMPVLAVGVFALRRQWRWLIAYCFWMAALLGFSIWRLGIQNHVEWFRRIYPTYACGAPVGENHSLAAFLEAVYFGRAFNHNVPLSIPHFLCWVAKIVGAAVYLGVLYWLWKKNRRADRLAYELTVMVVVALIVSPMVWRHLYLFALLPLGYLWTAVLRADGNWKHLGLLALVTVWVSVKLPEYLMLKVRLLGVLLLGSWVAIAFLLLWLCLKYYESATIP